MRIAVGSDHAGFIQKDPIVEHIKSLGHEVLDFGPANDDRVDYPDFAVNEAIVDTFLSTEFAGGRHTGRVEKIMREDDPNFKGVDAE